MYETDFLSETVLWKSFCTSVTEHHAQSYSYVLRCRVKQCSLLFSASPGPSPSVLTPFSCRLYFCGLHSKTRETFLPVFPNETRVSVSRYTPPPCWFLSSSHPQRRSETFNNGAVGLLFCTVSSCRYCALTVSIYHSAIDLSFLFFSRHGEQRKDRQSCIKVNSWAWSGLLKLITLSIKARLVMNSFRQLLHFLHVFGKLKTSLSDI